jgi:hypothetical protein
MFKIFKMKGKLTDFKIELLEENGSISIVNSMSEAKRATRERDIYDIRIPLPSGEMLSVSLNNYGKYQLKD